MTSSPPPHPIPSHPMRGARGSASERHRFNLDSPLVSTGCDLPASAHHERPNELSELKTHRKFLAGFTLIELLVVLVIMGIALGIMVQMMPDERATLREEAQRLALLLENAGMEARASGRPLAWSSEINGYRFWKKNDYGDWVRLDNDTMFRPHTLPEGLDIAEVSVESQPLKLGEQMSLNASSFTLPFHIRLTGEHASASVTGSSTGAVTAKLDSEN